MNQIKNNVQAFIDNISVPQSLDELKYFIENHGWYNVEDIMYDDKTSWTAPRWCKRGDVVFFMHAKSADAHLKRIRKEIREEEPLLDEYEAYVLNFWIKKGLRLHHMYGGKIYAIAVVTGAPYFEEAPSDDVTLHWSSRIYANMNVFQLDNPIDISEFRDFITVSRQSAITGVFGKEFDRLMKLITDKNNVPEYFKSCVAASVPLSKISENNYMQLTSEYRHDFFLESQFRSFYVDRFLRDFGDIQSFSKECACNKGSAPSFVDNLVLLNKKYLPVEVKLCVSIEPNLPGQLKKYMHTKWILTDKKKIMPEQLYNDVVMVIDTDNIYLYYDTDDVLEPIVSLDDIQSKEDIDKLRNIIIQKISVKNKA